MLCIHIYQKTGINTIILGNAHITKPSYLKLLSDRDFIMRMLNKNCY